MYSFWLLACSQYAAAPSAEYAEAPPPVDSPKEAEAQGRVTQSSKLMAAKPMDKDVAGFAGLLGARGNIDFADAEPAPTTPESAPERVRKWFPEAFLWQPMVETDASGRASVDVKVPDQLTTWRVLGLAHTRDGRQAGAVTAFDSRLPVYVDPVVPGWLFAGDRVVLPVQVANTTDAPLTALLTVESSGALHGNGGGNVTLVAGGSIVRSVALEAEGAGNAKVSAILSGADAVIRDIPVTPSGRPVTSVRGGMVSGEREFTIPGVDGADPNTEQITVLVFPGPLAVLQSELERGGDSESPAGAAYGFAVTTAWKDLAAATGALTDEKALRRKQIVAWQRVVPWGRAPSGGMAADLLLGLRDVRDDELATSMRDRLVQTLVSSQNGDGSWTRQGQGTVQQLVVQTSLAGYALPESASGARFRARGALKRNLAAVKDGYTAAVVLTSGLLDDDARKPLEDLVIAATEETDSGRKTVVPTNVVNPWGQRPSEAEMSAFAALALAGRADLPWRGDLVARLMSGYDASAGFGAGAADPIALEAVLSQLPGVDQPVEVALSIDGVEVSRAKLDPAQPKLPAVLQGAPRGGAHQVKISVTPQVPGLAWVATTTDWVAWTGDERLAGVDIDVHTSALRVGRDSDLTISAAAPSGVQLRITQGLPAGATVDKQSLDAISDRVVTYRILQDRVELTTRAFAAGEAMTIPLRVQPAFAGSYATTPLQVATLAGQSAHLAPIRWTVAE